MAAGGIFGWEPPVRLQIVVRCPYCGDWAHLHEVKNQLALGRFWCCAMCELAGRGPRGHLAREEFEAALADALLRPGCSIEAAIEQAKRIVEDATTEPDR